MIKIVALNAPKKEDAEEQEDTSTQVSKEAQVGVEINQNQNCKLMFKSSRKQLQFQNIFVLYR